MQDGDRSCPYFLLIPIKNPEDYGENRSGIVHRQVKWSILHYVILNFKTPTASVEQIIAYCGKRQPNRFRGSFCCQLHSRQSLISCLHALTKWTSAGDKSVPHACKVGQQRFVPVVTHDPQESEWFTSSVTLAIRFSKNRVHVQPPLSQAAELLLCAGGVLHPAGILSPVWGGCVLLLNVTYKTFTPQAMINWCALSIKLTVRIVSMDVKANRFWVIFSVFNHGSALLKQKMLWIEWFRQGLKIVRCQSILAPESTRLQTVATMWVSVWVSVGWSGVRIPQFFATQESHLNLKEDSTLQ